MTEWTQGESLRKHALAVETCVAAYGQAEAKRLGLTGPERAEERAALVELYSTTALLHDFDYERHPSLEEHPFVGVRELERLGWPQELRTAILGHAQYSGVPRVTHLDKVLFACDELAGFLTACALVKPTKAIADVEVAGVRKKMKDKAFAPRRESAGRDSRGRRVGRGSGCAHRVLPGGDERNAPENWGYNREKSRVGMKRVEGQSPPQPASLHILLAPAAMTCEYGFVLAPLPNSLMAPGSHTGFPRS